MLVVKKYIRMGITLLPFLLIFFFISVAYKFFLLLKKIDVYCMGKFFEMLSMCFS